MKPAITAAAMPNRLANPFASELAAANSSYHAPNGDRLARPLDPEQATESRAELAHQALRERLLAPDYPCVGAKSALHCGGYRIGFYDELGSTEATAGLAFDLYRFVTEQPFMTSEFTTFVASFGAPIPATEAAFERRLWAQLQRLHDLDRRVHRWDPSVASDPDDSDFSYSFAERGFFVVGMHPAASRLARRFAWPTLIFNAHDQFDRLREQGRFARLQQAIRSRDRGLQGSINPMLSDFGSRSEARQYAGRAVDEGWRCPFHLQPSLRDSAENPQ